MADRTAVTQKILRCLMLTQSPNEHEALVAIRKANQILGAADLNWEQFFGVALDMNQPERVQFKTASEMLSVVKAHLIERGSDAIAFIASLELDLINYGRLTPNQLAALEKFYKNATARKRA